MYNPNFFNKKVANTESVLKRYKSKHYSVFWGRERHAVIVQTHWMDNGSMEEGIGLKLSSPFC